MRIFILLLLPLTILAQEYGSWSEIDSLNEYRVGHAMVLLENGDILVSGNDISDSLNILAKSCEILSKTTKTWKPTASLNRWKYSHNMVLLNNGNVLTFGGGRENEKSCEIFDPNKEEWRLTDSMLNGRNFGGETFIKLNDGRIMVIGGSHYNFDGNPMIIYSECEIYDPLTEKWEIAAPLITKREYHSAVLLNDGRVLVSGGSNKYIDHRVPKGKDLKSCEIYNPQTNSWKETDSLSVARGGHSQVILDDGNVLLIGGTTLNDSTGSATAENRCAVFDVATEKWSLVGPLSKYRNSSGVFRLNDKYLIIVGGDASDSWEIYDLEKFESVYLENFGANQMIHGGNTIQMENKNILIAGGEEWFEDGIGGLEIEPTRRCWIFDKTTNVNNVINNLDDYKLFQNYPNPFNPNTNIEYVITEPSEVKIIVYNILGSHIKTLINENKKPGNYKTVWDSKDENGINQPSGVYLVKLITKSYSQTIKTLLIK